jgi:hypothetical protein
MASGLGTSTCPVDAARLKIDADHPARPATHAQAVAAIGEDVYGAIIDREPLWVVAGIELSWRSTAGDVPFRYRFARDSPLGSEAEWLCEAAPNRPRTAAFVKGFRTPAVRRRERMHGGRRPKSLEGGNRGVVCVRRWCRGLWGFNARR